MTTIQAAELRKNMDSYLKRASKGEKFKVTYRGKSLAVLTADDDSGKPNAPAVFAAAKAFNESLPTEERERLSKLTDRDIKKIRDDHMREKYGI